MDVAGLSMAMAQNNTMSKVSTAVLAKTLDNAEIAGEGIVKLMDAAAMERSVNPSVGGSIDIRL